jgi:hypothetical protein
MIFYTITHGGNVINWAGTQAEAKDLAKNYVAAQAGETVTWEPYEVPIDKPTLLAFLKANCVGKPVATVTTKAKPQS